MNFNPQVYNNLNNDTLLPALKLVEVINEWKSNNDDQSIIVDIGCGSGNMTKLLAEQITCGKVIGFDIDSEMIEFAEINNSKPNISYLVQDIQTHWKLFSEEIKALQNKVSVVTANFSLTWVKDIKTSAQNIANLLSDDGIVAINIVYDGDIYQRLSSEERIKAEKFLKYPSEEEMIGKWIIELKKVGLTEIEIQYWEPKSVFIKALYIEEYVNLVMNWFLSYANLKNGTNFELTKLIKRLLIEDRCNKLDIKSSDGEELVEVTNYVWQIVAKKP